MPVVRPALLLVLLAAAGCYQSMRPPCRDDAGREATARDVDLVIMMDDSPSMLPAQLAIARALPRLVRGLATGDDDGDPSTPARVPVRSLRVAVVSSDMGVLGVGTEPGERVLCGGPSERERAYYGADGAFQATPTGHDGALANTGYDCDFDDDGVPDVLGADGSPAFLDFSADGADADRFAIQASCYAVRGASGCGFEQPLAAVAKALTPFDSPLRFPVAPEDVGERDRGRGNDPLANGAFLRDGAVLVVVLITNEDDCSTEDRRMFDLNAPYPYGEGSVLVTANTRCVRYGDEPLEYNPSVGFMPQLDLMTPTMRYASALMALKPDPNDVVFALVAGIPPDVTPSGTQAERLATIATLLDPDVTSRMRVTLTSMNVSPSCEQCMDENLDGKCDIGFNDVDGNGLDSPECVPGDCGPGSTPRCTADLDRDGVCDPNEVETPYVDLNGNFVRDDGEPLIPDETFTAAPPRRLLRTARDIAGLGGNIGVQSICQADFTQTLASILEDVREVAAVTCD